MNIDLTAIFQAILALLAAIITYKVIPWIKARTTNEQQSLLKATVRTLVYAAEQLYGAGEGAKKLEWVAERLAEKGFSADRADIEAAIRENLKALHAEKDEVQESADAQDGQWF